ncbi:DNA-3-methyladenine glycosylase family protein [Jiulongibacter sediminis]|uniref:DNA-3-methyladenine glycosylase II n=1 Tax=Jiulongibacter sediminis TaxID=1605367 RepID=A0A0P7BR59_9BACT|nr:DNA-3-methyladenine glycosylase [Jiulongibacter sediminis]KPM46710.1 hypothetical protein AFM12_18195 [Jiulongibacter sediminis]TBX21615.1 hypothetical protein TK44_18200 [Jiulongibacter sediminis]
MKEASQFLIKNDPILGQIIQSTDLELPLSTNFVFHDLMSCVIEQQIHYRSTKKTFEKLLTKAGIETLTPENFHLIEQAGLTELKLSNQKLNTIQNILDFWEKEEPYFQSESPENMKQKLGTLKGFGPWTIDMIMLYTLGQPDVFPADDYHLKKAMCELYGLNPKVRLRAEMKQIAEKWKPYSSLAVLYILQWRKNK